MTRPTLPRSPTRKGIAPSGDSQLITASTTHVQAPVKRTSLLVLYRLASSTDTGRDPRAPRMSSLAFHRPRYDQPVPAAHLRRNRRAVVSVIGRLGPNSEADRTTAAAVRMGTRVAVTDRRGSCDVVGHWSRPGSDVSLHPVENTQRLVLAWNPHESTASYRPHADA